MARSNHARMHLLGAWAIAGIRRSKSVLKGVAASHLAGVLALVAVGLALACLIVTRGLARGLAEEAPLTALMFRSTEPGALVALASAPFKPEKAAAPAGGAEKAALPIGAEVGAQAKSAVAADPLNARAFVILGLLAERAGDKAGALKFMRAAARRSLHESGALMWLMRSTFESKDYESAIFHADALLRSRYDLVGEAMPTLAAFAENADERGRLVALLAANPYWRLNFFSLLPTHIKDARTPLKLMAALRDTPAPPTPDELGKYLSFLIGKRFYELAYYTWLQFLPPHQLASVGLLFNGGFEEAIPDSPFNWTLEAGAGATVDVAQRPDQREQRALFLKLGPGRVNFEVKQILVLAPASYKLGGKWKGAISGSRGVFWRVLCLNAKEATVLGESPMMIGEAADWTDFSLSFIVPASGCRAQVLHLEPAARSPSEQLMSGSVWFDDLRLVREAETGPPTLWPGFTSEELEP